MSVANDDRLSLTERMERAWLMLAYFIELDGERAFADVRKIRGRAKGIEGAAGREGPRP